MNAASNTAYAGDVAVSGYYLNPADANFREYMPGDLRGVSTTDKEGIFRIIRMRWKKNLTQWFLRSQGLGDYVV